MHETIGSGPDLLGRPLQWPTRGLNAFFYGNIRLVTRLVGLSIDGALGQLARRVGDPGHAPSRPRPEDSVLAILNGVLGDYLRETGNPLAIRMHLRHAGLPLDLNPRALLAAMPESGRKLLVVVHGSCLSDERGRRHGDALGRDLGYTPVYVFYNTGLHISANGRSLAALLESLVLAWPGPLDEIVLLAHSMGGLISRSACHLAEEQGYSWRKKLRGMVFLGTPHHGAPLERGGYWFHQLLEANRYSAPLARLAKIRSAGVTDMRHGSVLDENWQGRDRFSHARDTRTPLPLPVDVACYAIAASKGRAGGGKMPGDGLVPVDSALGRHVTDRMRLEFPESRQWIGCEMGHLDLLDRADVYATIRDWLSSRASEGPARGVISPSGTSPESRR